VLLVVDVVTVVHSSIFPLVDTLAVFNVL
jgi:hypothetical protein